MTLRHEISVLVCCRFYRPRLECSILQCYLPVHLYFALLRWPEVARFLCSSFSLTCTAWVVVADRFIYTGVYRPEWIVTAAEVSVYHVQNPVPATQFSAKPRGALLSKWGNPFSCSPNHRVIFDFLSCCMRPEGPSWFTSPVLYYKCMLSLIYISYHRKESLHFKISCLDHCIMGNNVKANLIIFSKSHSSIMQTKTKILWVKEKPISISITQCL